MTCKLMGLKSGRYIELVTGNDATNSYVVSEGGRYTICCFGEEASEIAPLDWFICNCTRCRVSHPHITDHSHLLICVGLGPCLPVAYFTDPYIYEYILNGRLAMKNLTINNVCWCDPLRQSIQIYSSSLLHSVHRVCVVLVVSESNNKVPSNTRTTGPLLHRGRGGLTYCILNDATRFGWRVPW